MALTAIIPSRLLTALLSAKQFPSNDLLPARILRFEVECLQRPATFLRERPCPLPSDRIPTRSKSGPLEQRRAESGNSTKDDSVLTSRSSPMPWFSSYQLEIGNNIEFGLAIKRDISVHRFVILPRVSNSRRLPYLGIPPNSKFWTLTGPHPRPGCKRNCDPLPRGDGNIEEQQQSMCRSVSDCMGELIDSVYLCVTVENRILELWSGELGVSVRLYGRID
ncbi:hypothetical protein B0T20DRAFT_252511 [Sordaria brevicollis]|uniref:Uncharacterized protein n=1 Tax=Sordaria brevicollis TaxID=83679 RepID=A0AAE0UAQ4_SORBR|nr:hypothetical protein B0T20DRAFT_252511 [Sordaria brevicollis]